MNINIDNFIDRIKPFVYLFLFMYLFNCIVFFILPKKGINFFKDDLNSWKTINYKYYSSDLKEIQKKLKITKVKTLSDYSLNGIYLAKKSNSWIAVRNRKKNITLVLKLNEKIDNYTLINIYPKFVIFEKNGINYKLELKSYKNILDKFLKNDKDNDIKTIDRQTFDSYVNHIDNIWKEVDIEEDLKNNKIDGFKLVNISSNSILNKLGLKKGDIIKKVNGIRINSYTSAMNAFIKVKNNNNIFLDIVRENKKMELNYEIN